jgi:hypothetical protein
MMVGGLIMGMIHHGCICHPFVPDYMMVHSGECTKEERGNYIFGYLLISLYSNIKGQKCNYVIIIS